MWANDIGQTLISLGKMALRSRPVGTWPSYSGKPAVVLGAAGGLPFLDPPAKLEYLSDAFAWFVTNNFAQTPLFQQLRPEYYVLIDPKFWAPENAPGHYGDTTRATWDALVKLTTWPMHLMLPRRVAYFPIIQHTLRENSNLKAVWFNHVKYKGLERVGFWFWRRKWCTSGLPFSGNAAAFLAITLGAPAVYLCGVSNSYVRFLEVDADNVTWALGAYGSKKEHEEKGVQYKSLLPHGLSEVLRQTRAANENFGELRRYAENYNQQLYNATPDSLIDQLERRSLPNV